jgi:plasmid rolling circle replication initiator protein Rep
MPKPAYSLQYTDNTTKQNARGHDPDILTLSELSPRDKPWEEHKFSSDLIQLYYESASYTRYSERIKYCSDLLGFGLVSKEDSTLALKLRSARFCRVRHCPVCQWRRSLMWQAKAHRIIPKIIEKYPTYRWLFLTLTIKNCPVEELRKTVDHMNKSYRRFIQRKSFPAVGWLRTLEVSRGADGSAHPHFHCLLLVRPGFFSDGYLSHSDWVELWGESLRVDYAPKLNIKAVAKGQKPDKLIPEIIKYCTKESDLIKDESFFIELTKQLHKTRALTTGGILKEYLRELEEEPEDLIGEDGETSEEYDYGQVLFEWKKRRKKYQVLVD